ncbi:ABC transporter ATP-binding protein [Ornithinibacillus salinisoli]|uniref:ABC transporter ATP-binding protein n=1 Tax=Ornithinibacillus salinisoli TaxID=1848459 RepID=A0ABW4W3T4_9BACI
MSDVAMELIDVKKTIGKKEIIKGLSFSIHKGEVFGFIGPNGAGKTTTIRMMVGLMRLTDGDVRILGKSITTNYKEAVREVGAIVENPEMYPFMSGWQNLKHYARMIPGISKERIQEVISLVGLEKVIKEKVGRYSLGMRQRLGIAQALLHNPSILILDEPTNGLDPAGIREIREYIRKIAREQQVAVIISSHLLAEIEQVCDRIGIIKNGEMIAIQSVNDQQEAAQENLSQVQMEVSPIDKAKNLLKEKYEIDVDVEEDSLSFQYNKADIPELIRLLVAEEINVFQVGISKVTLEDKFFDLIGENVIG